MKIFQYILLIILVSGVLISGCIQASETQKGQNGADNLSNKSFVVSVNSAINGSTLPTRFTCMGPGQVPSIFWKNAPSAAKSMLLIMDDPDAQDKVFTHWIVYNLSPGDEVIPPNQVPAADRAGSGYQGVNSFGSKGYYPPCPPGGQTHRYIFTLYALDSEIHPDPADRSHVDAAMEGHVLAKARSITFFGQ
jgi:Raf kinase inhibitor-like YbhB/YbcL family protein